MKRQKKVQVIASLLIIFAIFVFTEIKAESSSNGTDRIIEVCTEGVVYVPPGTRTVKCNGKTKRVIRVTPYQSNLMMEEESCICNSCCDGVCAVIISCDAEPVELSDSYINADGLLCLLWIECD